MSIPPSLNSSGNFNAQVLDMKLQLSVDNSCFQTSLCNEASGFNVLNWEKAAATSSAFGLRAEKPSSPLAMLHSRQWCPQTLLLGSQFPPLLSGSISLKCCQWVVKAVEAISASRNLHVGDRRPWKERFWVRSWWHTSILGPRIGQLLLCTSHWNTADLTFLIWS